MLAWIKVLLTNTMEDFQVNSIALKTLKQRCEYLQQRLRAVEEENCKLKLENAQELNRKTPREASKLEERIIILNKEKSQMAHQIHMITNENSALWSQLSKILPDNSISSLKISVPPSLDNQVVKLNQYEKTSNDYSKESLEEISLKLINGIIMGKNELEKQYSQMVDLQKENLAEECSSFSHKQIDNRIAAKNFKDYVQRLKDFKQALLKQKSELSNAITFIKSTQILSRPIINTNNMDIPNFNQGMSDYKEGNNTVNQTGSEFSTLLEPGGVANGSVKFDSSDKICPMCQKNFIGSFKDFEEHVSGHFADEFEDFVDASPNFEDMHD